ncbi:tryptophan-rich sensory protein [Saccharibacillus alkalitolerans]|uniref:Tryptophan-rich sensory protein n=1 Tax=Saccharibacillus alkalitolerans TaxID=2705290 RepID=A0ABX0FAI7_9BACL|nr:tryptophan-rich sensory protein [Saccharibacillus alkalitolerans]NGZ77410.1 tryptophan-rich sensory protein [Saccharibacillus alkalitolerans]
MFSSSKNPYKWLNAVLLAAVIAVNAMATLLPLAGRDTGEISDMYKNLLTPAGFAFSIWSVIYVLLIGFVVYGFVAERKDRASAAAPGPWFAVSCVLNMAWLFCWHYLLIELSVVVMLLLLVSLIMIYVRTRLDRERLEVLDILFVKVPFSLYLGWISVATIVNISALVTKHGFGDVGLGDTGWAIVMLIAALLLALVIGFRYRDGVYPLVFAWALYAISVEQADTVQAVHTTALATSIAAAAFALWMFVRSIMDRD